jgi:tyrosinase
MKRRWFIACSVCAAIAAKAPPLRAAAVRTRLEIGDFSNDAALVAALRKAVKTLRDSTAGPTNPQTWKYWFYSHWMPPDVAMILGMDHVFNQCLHGREYFYPWHRGVVYFFERALQQASGNPDLMLPYWDYYKNPAIPQIYSDPTLADGSDNPLYLAGRTGTGAGAIGLEAFNPSVTVFPRSFAGGDSYEALIESDPHATVHGSVGGAMGLVPTAAADPIFWIHHCNIDRLWAAWVAAGNGRAMPPGGNGWWAKAWSYDLAGAWHLSTSQMADTTALGYTYADLSLPTQAPSLPTPPPLVATRAHVGTLAFRANLVGATGSVALGLRSVSVSVPFQHTHGAMLHSLLEQRVSGATGVAVELDDTALTTIGEKGGYSYDVYLNLPQRAPEGAATRTYYLGSLSQQTVQFQAGNRLVHPACNVQRASFGHFPADYRRCYPHSWHAMNFAAAPMRARSGSANTRG